MQVETYEVEEITGELGVMAADSEALELIEKLGLTGQKSLSDPKTGTRQPYAVMTALQRNICDVMFPEHTPIERYSQGPIPLRVLQVAAHAKEMGFFKSIEVWHPTSIRDKDPVLVGNGPDPANPTWTWSTVPFLLARWGDALESWEVLAQKAKQRWVVTAKPKLVAVKAKADSDLARLDSIAANAFDAGLPLEIISYEVK